MPDLRFVLGDRQSASILDFEGSEFSARSCNRKLFFSAEPKNSSSVAGMSVTDGGNTVEIFETLDGEMFGTVDASDALDANGKATVVQISATLGVPHRVFQQLLAAQMEDTIIWLELKAKDTSRDKYGFDTAGLTFARFSFMRKEEQGPKAAPQADAVLKRIFWAIVVLGVALLWRLQ